MTPDHDLAARLAAARNAPRGVAEDPCPEPGEWAVFVEGELPTARRPDLEAHLTRCGPCLETVLALEAELAAASRVAPAAPRGRHSWHVRLLAAALVVATLGGVTLWFLHREDDPRPGPIAVAEEALRRDDPVLAASVAVLRDDELAALAPAPLRGGLRIGLPQGTLLGVRPRIRVMPVVGARTYAARVTDADGQVVAQADLPAPEGSWPDAFPDLLPGREYVLRIEVGGPARREVATSAFRTATEQAIGLERDAGATLRSSAPQAVAALLAARRLLRGKHYEAAERALEAALADPRTAPEVQELAARLGARTGYGNRWQVPPR